MTQKYKYVDQEGEYTVTRDEIMGDFYPWWCSKLKKVRKEHLISEERCIKDFCNIHGAVEVA